MVPNDAAVAVLEPNTCVHPTSDWKFGLFGSRHLERQHPEFDRPQSQGSDLRQPDQLPSLVLYRPHFDSKNSSVCAEVLGFTMISCYHEDCRRENKGQKRENCDMGTLYIESECKAEKEKRHGIHWKLHHRYASTTNSTKTKGPALPLYLLPIPWGGWQHGTRTHIYIYIWYIYVYLKFVCICTHK